MKKKLQRESSSSEILLKIADDKSLKNNLTYKRLLQELGRRSFGVAVLLFALPSALPLSIIPGFSLIFSVPIAFFALQIIIGVESLWLPKFIANKKLSHAKLSAVISKSMPYLKKLERLLKPRLQFMTTRIPEVITGIIILIVSLLLMLPIPFSNFIFALFIALLGLGIAEKDGLVILITSIIIIIFIASSFLVLVTALKALF